MENKRNQCRECGGNGKPSKGIMNFHNIQTQDLSKEFETKVLDCIKCESCGHSWVPEKSKSLGKTSDEIEKSRSTRKQAILWWNTMNGTFKQRNLGLKYYSNRDFLTGREIEEIWKNEVQVPELRNVEHNSEYLDKPNQKQSHSGISKMGTGPGIKLNQKPFSLEPEQHQIVDVESKKNQKQFKNFDESLFQAYVDKFSDEDKVSALRVLFKSIGITSKDKLEYYLARY